MKFAVGGTNRIAITGGTKEWLPYGSQAIKIKLRQNMFLEMLRNAIKMIVE